LAANNNVKDIATDRQSIRTKGMTKCRTNSTFCVNLDRIAEYDFIKLR
jgi:hypothetical protein